MQRGMGFLERGAYGTGISTLSEDSPLLEGSICITRNGSDSVEGTCVGFDGSYVEDSLPIRRVPFKHTSWCISSIFHKPAAVMSKSNPGILIRVLVSISSLLTLA